jgi:hypothetical protein
VKEEKTHRISYGRSIEGQGGSSVIDWKAANCKGLGVKCNPRRRGKVSRSKDPTFLWSLRIHADRAAWIPV